MIHVCLTTHILSIAMTLDDLALDSKRFNDYKLFSLVICVFYLRTNYVIKNDFVFTFVMHIKVNYLSKDMLALPVHIFTITLIFKYYYLSTNDYWFRVL